MHPNTHAEAIIDKNGITTMRHKRNETAVVASRLVAMDSKSITGAARQASSSAEEKANFDMATLFIKNIMSDAKTISVVEIDNKLELAAINGEVVEQSNKEFLASVLLSNAGISAGNYKLSEAIKEDKTLKVYTATYRINPLSVSSTTTLNNLEAIVASQIAKTSIESEYLDYLCNDFGDEWIRALSVINPHTSQDTINGLQEDPSDNVRAFVARRTENEEVISNLLRDSSQNVLSEAAKRSFARPEDLVAAYDRADNFETRALIVGHTNTPISLVQRAYENDWSARVIGVATPLIDNTDKTLWENNAPKGFLKDNTIKEVAKRAADYTKSVAGNKTNTSDSAVFLTDEEARAVAWRVSSKMTSGIDSFKAFDAGNDFDLQRLVSEAAIIKNLGMAEKAYGMRWEADSYMDSIIGWARNKQGRH